MSFFIEPPVLEGEHVRIEALRADHVEHLFNLGQDPTIWKWLPKSEFRELGDAQDFVAEALRLKTEGTEFPLVVVQSATGKVAGTTRYLEISPMNRSLEIGWTWYGTQYQRTPVNTESKLLLMEYAFEKLGAIRLQLKTDSRNLRSQTAIQRIGAKFEGTLRNHRILQKDGYIRDTVYFSVLDNEWPETKRKLIQMLSR